MQLIIVAAVLVAFTAITPIASRTISRWLSKHESENRRALAQPAGKFVSTLMITAGLVVTLGIISPGSLEPFPAQIVSFLPRLLITVLLFLVGSTVASIVSGVVGLAATKSTGKPQPGIVRMVKGIVTGLIGLLAIGQLGVNTRVLDTVTQAVVFSAAATVALLCVVGGRELASNISAGRYLRRIIRAGDQIEAGPGSGTVVAVHGATVQLEDEDGWVLHVPNHLLLGQPVRVKQHQSAADQTD
jgi:hypothetical protein